MKIFKQYLLRTVLRSTGLVTMFLLVLQFLILFMSELSDVGQGGYSLTDALTYVVLRLPYEIYNFLPIASLMGALIGLGTLSANSELTAARVAGFSKFKIISSLLQFGLLTFLVIGVIGEYFIPELFSYAETQKIVLKSGGQAIKVKRGLWLKQNNSFIYIGRVKNDQALEAVTEYQFTDKGAMRLVRHIDKAFLKDGQWHVLNMKTTKMTASSLKDSFSNKGIWPISLKKEQLTITNKDMEEMSLKELWHYIHIQRKAQMATQAQEINFWQRIIQPFSAIVMLLLALPCVFGLQRSRGFGVRVMLGVAIGFSFYIINRLLMSLGLIYMLPAFWVSAAPTLFVLTASLLMLARQKN